MSELSETLRKALAAGEPAVLVSVQRTVGSAPREAGAAMLVTRSASAGSIGGGQLEWQAMARAHEIIAGSVAPGDHEVALGPSLGQCCGGKVSLRYERLDAAVLARHSRGGERPPPVLLFGAGHVGQALARALTPLPLDLTVIDQRRDLLRELPDAATGLASADPAAEVAEAPAGAAYVVMTHDHGLDYAIAAAALTRGDAAYVGLIGSATKRARFARWFRAQGGTEPALDALVCPIGAGGPRDKRPAVIAAMVAAELAARLLSDRPARYDDEVSDRVRSEGAGGG